MFSHCAVSSILRILAMYEGAKGALLQSWFCQVNLLQVLHLFL